MKYRRLTLADCAQATGAVIVIDVLRAFTTAAYAFAGGASEIVLVGGVDEALALRKRFPDALVMGEVGGLRAEGFDLGNSPSALMGLNLAGRRLIQRTTAGTQGIVCAVGCGEVLLAASLSIGAATARYIRRLAPTDVTFVITGIGAGRADNDGDEDVACADYIEALLQGETPDPAPFVARVRRSSVARKFLALGSPDFPPADLECATAVDCFDFALPVTLRDGLAVMRAVPA